MDWVEVRQRYYYAYETLFYSAMSSIIIWIFYVCAIGVMDEVDGLGDATKSMSMIVIFMIALIPALAMAMLKGFPAFVIGGIVSTILLRRKIRNYIIWGTLSSYIGLMCLFLQGVDFGFYDGVFLVPLLTGIFMCRYARAYYQKLEIDGEAV